jgi:cytochrome c oxidase subunit III
MNSAMARVNEQRKKIHPHKFSMWIAIASIIMAFAALTSAYLVKMNQDYWVEYRLPLVFTISTIVILASSGTMHLAVKAAKLREMPRYRMLITLTALLGLVFVALQIAGFYQVHGAGVKLVGERSNAAGSFLLAIAGLHIVHMLGGVIALLVMFFRAFSRKTRVYSLLALCRYFVGVPVHIFHGSPAISG